MGKNGPEFYDDASVFATYVSKRETQVDGPNDTLEKPVFDELLGNLTNLRILDLGCGNAGFGLEVLQQGCGSYLGIDGSTNMAAAAKQKLAGTQGKVIQASIESWNYPSGQFDLVTSRLASITFRRSSLCSFESTRHWLKEGALFSQLSILSLLHVTGRAKMGVCVRTGSWTTTSKRVRASPTGWVAK